MNEWRRQLWLFVGMSVLSCGTWGWGQTNPMPMGESPRPPTKFEQAIKDAKKTADGGLFTVYYKDQQILVELKPTQLNQDYLMLTSIARGVSRNPIIGGMTWGDDVIWTFRKVGDKLHVLRKNVRFKAKAGTPEATAVRFAYPDSVLYALPIVADGPGGTLLVDMTRVFFSDDEMIGRFLNANFVPDRSTVAKVKAFPRNVELQINAVYQANPAGAAGSLETVPDVRGIPIVVHYSISTLPNTGYKPRKADDRVGYFLVVTKDFSDPSDEQNFVRYITRWDLQKADASARLSPPKDPIIFYLEKTVPIALRPTVRAGIEEWNKAFEKIGFAHAIDVRQQRDDDDWDPEDVNYNTFRWITAEAGFAMGPSRVNPYTGQILDADIIFDASFLRSWKIQYENFTAQMVAELLQDGPVSPDKTLPWSGGSDRQWCSLSQGMQQQTAFAAAYFLLEGVIERRGELPEEFLHQALKEVVMHEVGHTLGLRHNFKASAWKTLAEINDPARKSEPLVASVMDYHPVNITPPGTPHTAYYTTTLGPYDFWAIEYGYKPISGDESAELAKIAARSGEAGHDYATDEDTEDNDPDPLTNRFDLGKNPLDYAQQQRKLVLDLLPKVVERSVGDGEGYQRARQAFGVLWREIARTAHFVSLVPGGVLVHRDHKGDVQARPPFVVYPADQQRAATRFLLDEFFAAPQFDPNVLNSLAASRWRHWGVSEPDRIDYPIHQTVLQVQQAALSRLLNPYTLARMLDNEVRVPQDADAYTLAEHLAQIVEGVFKEILQPQAGEYSLRRPYINSYRRQLQQTAILRLIDLSLARGGVMLERSGSSLRIINDITPQDARVLTRMHLQRLNTSLEQVVSRQDLKLDDYTQAHLQDLHEQVKKALSAQMVLTTP
ncbi:MAG: hypothetical protein KatS3mg113_0162 [Planctomycetaceae bacterium]|nr:MAG: hypothetical protein KatS3mg113_0162 [Planctomycetaceae bacterium]